MKKISSIMLAMALVICSIFGYLGLNNSKQTVNAEAKVYASTETIYAEGGTGGGVVSERIDYAYKIEDEYRNPYKMTNYPTIYTCGIHAGGNIIATYDRVFEGLIPERAAGKTFLGQWLWGSQDSYINAMFASVYSAMGSDPEGVTINGYKSGLSSYVSGKGRSISQPKCMSSNGVLNSSQYKAALSSGKLMSVFMDGFAFVMHDGFLTYSNYDTINHYVYMGAHVMAAYGYLDVSYYNAQNQCFRKDSYLYVTTGFDAPLSLVKLNQYGVIDDGYIHDIY